MDNVVVKSYENTPKFFGKKELGILKYNIRKELI